MRLSALGQKGVIVQRIQELKRKRRQRGGGRGGRGQLASARGGRVCSPSLLLSLSDLAAAVW